jgi:spermidine synthase
MGSRLRGNDDARTFRDCLIRVLAPVFLLCALLAACAGTPVYEGRSEYSHIQVVDRGSQRALLFVDDQGNADVTQTLIDRNAPERLQHAYARAMMAGLVYPPETKSVLLVGLGGGAFVHFMNRYFPELRLDVVELDPAVVKVARDYFGTKESARTRIFVADGRDFLQRATERYDLILLDAHLHPGSATDKTGHPLSLQTQVFYKSLYERLAPGGVALFNLIARGEERAYIASICRAFAGTELLWTPGRGNVIVIAAPNRLPSDRTLQERAAVLDRGGSYGFSFVSLIEVRQPTACGN